LIRLRRRLWVRVSASGGSLEAKRRPRRMTGPPSE